ncbi:DUF4279 domain-containing protein [Bradyrhizobium manausense]|uniref:DUF4279 domain-containing protein n=1 Tax=Bradyrhizobium manausense TaxID=989370 RepID=UPI001BA55A88|nr:DUF4279 domain-containing protein [Bradyrhizobium manausense]
MVCKALGLKPEFLWKAGEKRQTPRGTRIGGVRTESYCSIDFGESRREGFARQMQAALARLKPHRRTLRKLTSTGGRVSFFVGWFCDKHTGESLDRQLLGGMAELQIAIDLNIHIPD